MRIAAVIPTHNRAEWVLAAVASVQTQTRPLDEIIVVDDGSTDDTATRIRQEFPDVTVLGQDNQGVSAARNRAIKHANSDWIAFLDSDDRWYPDKIARQLDALATAPDYRLVHCDEHWFRNGRRVNPRRRHQKQGGWIFEHCLPLCAISPSAAMVRRDLLLELRGFDEQLPACEDYDLWLRITAREPVLYVDAPLLAKTGGHDDQLSRRYPAMDRFRLQAMAALAGSGTLTLQQQAQLQQQFRLKWAVYSAGALRRGRHEEVAGLSTRYRELIASD